jgi:hypothetical protein
MDFSQKTLPLNFNHTVTRNFRYRLDKGLLISSLNSALRKQSGLYIAGMVDDGAIGEQNTINVVSYIQHMI